MSKNELHDWEYVIKKLSGNNADKMLDIAQDIYNTAFVRGKNYMTLEQKPKTNDENAIVIKKEIVTCKECKYWHNDGIMTTCDKNIGNGFPEDYFCANGEKKYE